MRPLHTSLTLLVGTALALGAVGCGGDRDGAGGTPGGSATAVAASQLSITVRPSPHEASKHFTLVCDPARGDVPSPKRACRALEKADHPFAPVRAGTMCTQIFGGPQTATVRGTWHGHEVEATYARKNGCQVHRWDAIGAVLPADLHAGGTAHVDAGRAG